MYSSDADFVMTLRVLMTKRRFKIIITTIPDFFQPRLLKRQIPQGLLYHDFYLWLTIKNLFTPFKSTQEWKDFAEKAEEQDSVNQGNDWLTEF